MVAGLAHCGAQTSVGALSRLDSLLSVGWGCRGDSRGVGAELAGELEFSENKARWTCRQIPRLKWVKEFPKCWSGVQGSRARHRPLPHSQCHARRAGRSPRHLCLSLGRQNWLYRISCQPDPRHRLPQGLSLFQRP